MIKDSVDVAMRFQQLILSSQLMESNQGKSEKFQNSIMWTAAIVLAAVAVTEET